MPLLASAHEIVTAALPGPGMVIEKDAVAEDQVRPKDAEAVEHSRGGLARTAQQLLVLGHGLSRMDGDTHPAAAGLGDSLLDQLLGTGLDLRWRDHAVDAAAGMRAGLVHESQSLGVALASLSLVPLEVEAMASGHAPLRLSKSRCEV